MSDLEAYRTVIEGLHDQAQACKVTTPPTLPIQLEKKLCSDMESGFFSELNKEVFK